MASMSNRMARAGTARPCFRLGRWLVGGAFLVAGTGKLLGQDDGYLTPLVLSEDEGVFWVAIVVEGALPFVEVIIAGSILTQVGMLLGSVVSVLLSAAFVYYGVMLPDGTTCECLGVFGGFQSRWIHVGLAGMLGVGSCALAVMTFRERA